MSKRYKNRTSVLQLIVIFIAACSVMIGFAFGAVYLLESRTQSLLREQLDAAQIDWVTVETDGMQVTLSGSARDESARIRALSIAASVVDAARLQDLIDVPPTTAMTPPRFSVELLRNDDGIQLIGLLPKPADEKALTHAQLVSKASALTAEDSYPTDMLQASSWPAPEGWDTALNYGFEALAKLHRSKISVSANRVEITAILASEAEKRRLSNELTRAKPKDMELVLNLSAPRPVITPFTMRFIKDAEGARFDSCSADTPRAQRQILTTATAAGVESTPSCTIGIGSPTPRWAEGVTLAIKAVQSMGAGSVTFNDADITLIGDESVSQEAFDTAVGELRAKLPSVFSLTITPPKAHSESQGPVEFLARLSSNGQLRISGLLLDDTQQAAVDAIARASFGGKNVQVATRLDPAIPDGWPVRVMSGLQSLAILNEGVLMVRPDHVNISGVSGNPNARSQITQILSEHLGQGKNFRVDVRYDEKLDPLAALPTPQECALEIAKTGHERKITFTPGSANLTPEARPIIDKLVEILKNCPGLPLEIAGHTDSQGSETGNLNLSQSRAEAVLTALSQKRADTSQMIAKGYGETHPIADNATEAGREANRRIDFILRQDKIEKPEAAVPAADTDADTPPEASDPSLGEDDDIIMESDDALPLGAPELDDGATQDDEPEAQAENNDTTVQTPDDAAISVDTSAQPETTADTNTDAEAEGEPNILPTSIRPKSRP